MYKEKIVNVETGEETWRDLSKEEIAEIEFNKSKIEETNKKLDQVEQNRKSALSKLSALGLTEDEIAAL